MTPVVADRPVPDGYSGLLCDGAAAAAARPFVPNRFISIARHTTMTAALRLTLKLDADGTGELCAEVQVNGFSGVGAAWFNIAEIRDFGHRISRTYPLLPEQTYELQGGYWSREQQGSLEHVHPWNALLSLRSAWSDRLSGQPCHAIGKCEPCTRVRCHR